MSRGSSREAATGKPDDRRARAQIEDEPEAEVLDKPAAREGDSGDNLSRRAARQHSRRVQDQVTLRKNLEGAMMSIR